MTRLESLEAKVRELYESKDPDRDDWADWLYEQYIFIVADNAEKLAVRFGANKEYARGAAMLHDIADAKMKRFDDGHEQVSLDIARELLTGCGYAEDEMRVIVDAIRLHSCRDGQLPVSLEGRVLATADSLAHLTTDFYETAVGLWRDRSGDVWARQKVLGKLDRDFDSKILFSEVREEVRADYERLKQLYLG